MPVPGRGWHTTTTWNASAIPALSPSSLALPLSCFAWWRCPGNKRRAAGKNTDNGQVIQVLGGFPTCSVRTASVRPSHRDDSLTSVDFPVASPPMNATTAPPESSALFLIFPRTNRRSLVATRPA